MRIEVAGIGWNVEISPRSSQRILRLTSGAANLTFNPERHWRSIDRTRIGKHLTVGVPHLPMRSPMPRSTWLGTGAGPTVWSIVFVMR